MQLALLARYTVEHLPRTPQSALLLNNYFLSLLSLFSPYLLTLTEKPWWLQIGQRRSKPEAALAKSSAKIVVDLAHVLENALKLLLEAAFG